HDPPALHSFPTRRSSDLRIERTRSFNAPTNPSSSRRKPTAPVTARTERTGGLENEPIWSSIENSRHKVKCHPHKMHIRLPTLGGDRKSTRLNSSHDQISY